MFLKNINNLGLHDALKIQSVRNEIEYYIDRFPEDSENEWFYTIEELDVYSGNGEFRKTHHILSNDEIADIEKVEGIKLHDFFDFKVLLSKCNPQDVASFLESNGYYYTRKDVSFRIEYITDSNPRLAFKKYRLFSY